MRSLFLVRHAKASHDSPTGSDRDRPLDRRGEADAQTMGRRLAHCHVKPDLIVSSPALRAQATARLIAEELGVKHRHLVVDDRLYAASPKALLEVIHELEGKVDCAMLVGHNPEFAELAYRLSGTITEMPTCAVAEFRFDTPSWSDVGATAPTRAALDTLKP
jgi:phosphohistidine phosphatase